jgi:hypothetical protein
MALKGLARLLAVAHRDPAPRDQAAEARMGRRCMGNAVGMDGQDPRLVPPGLARRATTITVSYFCLLSSFPFTVQIVHPGLLLVSIVVFGRTQNVYSHRWI